MTSNEQEQRKKRRITVYTAGHCTPCEEIKDMLNKGQFLVDGEEGEVDLIDIETDEGFEQAQKQELSAVPEAFYEGKKCKIKVDEESHTVLLECNEDGKQENGSGK